MMNNNESTIPLLYLVSRCNVGESPVHLHPYHYIFQEEYKKKQFTDMDRQKDSWSGMLGYKGYIYTSLNKH